jgi:hypothetical protein
LDYVPEERELVHKDLKNAVLKRDGVCLFCWNRKPVKGAHIIAQRIDNPVAYDETSLLTRVGLHQVQNGLLLCRDCQDGFDALKLYVDVVDDKLVLKVVNDTDDENNFEFRHSIKIPVP